MMQRLFELEPRAASMTVSDPSARASTQASNFSLRMRSAAPVLTGIASIPNCRKHSASNTREGSLNPTNAALAAAFRVKGKGARVVSKALSIGRGRLHFRNSLCGRPGGFGKFQRTNRSGGEGPLPDAAEREKGHYARRRPGNEKVRIGRGGRNFLGAATR